MRKLFAISYFIVLPTWCMAMADSTPPVYGRPTLYGEYEFSSADVNRAQGMYGDGHRAAPIRAGLSKIAAKHPIKNKAVKPKKKAKKTNKKQTQLTPELAAAAQKPAENVIVDAASVVAQTEPVAQSEPVVAPVPVIVVPTAEAVSIAESAAAVDISAFCTGHTTQPTGKLPDGFVLMPGRPDLMSCTGADK